jgi:hypothetical protein
MVSKVETETKQLYETAVEPTRVKKAPKTLFVGLDGGFIDKWKQKGKHFEVKAVTIIYWCTSFK